MGLKNLAKMINNATKEKTFEERFLYELSEATSKNQKPRSPSRTFKPSSLGGCMRRMFFEVTGAEIDLSKPTDAGLVGINESGTDRHERIQKHIASMKEYGFNVDFVDVGDFVEEHKPHGTRVVEKMGMETKLFNDVLNLSFMCDGILKIDGIHYILEIKTEASFKWQGRNAPEEKHKYQAASYSVALGISKVLFLYENRDVCAKKAYLVEISQDERIERVYARIEEVNEHIRAERVPDVSEQDKKDCKYCPFTNSCKAIGGGF
jgi:CRISPR/Cas system-associated exonuclease Cas4 (RecB family)